MNGLDSHVRPFAPRHNAQTAYFLDGYGPRLPDLRAAYTFARETARTLRDDLGGRAGHRVFWIGASGWGSRSLRAEPDAFVVAGRHTCSSIVLPDDPHVSLRHLLVRSIPIPTGGTAVRILDLHTGTGFQLADGTRQTSVVAQGPVAIGVGSYALVALPSGPLPEALPEPEVAPCSVNGPYRTAEKPLLTSRITLMPRLVTLGESALARPPSGASYTVTLFRNGHAASVRVDDTDLLGGVVIGRSEKCHAEALRRITAEGTSRLHCLLLRDGDGIHAYDVASTQGTYFLGARVRRVALGDSTELSLGQGSSAVTMRWQRS